MSDLLELSEDAMKYAIQETNKERLKYLQKKYNKN